jgi:hypothetical protein
MYAEMRPMRWAVALLLGFVLTACADDFAGSREITSSSACVAQDGDWTSVVDLYPGRELTEADRHDFMCNRRTHDAGKSCTDRIGQCEGLCLAPEGARIGQTVSGKCSAHMIVPDNALKVGKGKVLDQRIQY